MSKGQEMALCLKIAQLSRCKKRKVGSVIYDKDGRILSLGFNYGECTFNTTCFQHQLQLKCGAIHSEQHAISNAMLEMPESLIGYAYEARITLSPCLSCLMSLHKIGIKVIKYIEEHKTFVSAKQYALDNGIELIQVEL